MKVIVAGSRSINDLDLVSRVIESSGLQITELVCGCARGVDSMGRKWAGNGNRVPVKLFPAEWDLFGKSAGYKRNIAMANYADALIAIWDRKSRDTKHMIDIARDKGLEVIVYYYTNKEISDDD